MSLNICTLNDICSSISYGVVSGSKAFDNKNRLLRITDLNSSYNTNKETKVSPRKYSSKYIVSNGNILIVRIGNRVGESYIHVSDCYDTYFAGYLIKLHINEFVNNYYIYYLTKSISFNNFISKVLTKKKTKSISITDLKPFSVALPLMEEQDIIVKQLQQIDNKKCTLSKLLRVHFFT